MSFPTIPTDLIDAIIDQVALLTPTGKELGPTTSSTSTLSSCALTSRAFVFPSQKHIFHTIDLGARLPRGVYYVRFHRLLLSNPYLGTHVRHLRLVDNCEDFANGISWLTHLSTPISRTLGFLPNLHSFGLNFNSTGANWDTVPDETRAAFGRVFRMESVKEVELEFAFGFPAVLLMSLARLKYLALSNVDLDTDEGIHPKSPCEVALEGLYLRGVSSGVIKTLTKTLSSTDAPPTLRKLALTPTFEEGFAEAVAELIITCGSHLESFAWLPSIHFRESSIIIHARQTTDTYFLQPATSFGPISISTLHHLRSLHFVITFRNLSSRKKPFAQTLILLLQLSNRPNALEKITLECHCITKIDTSEKSLGKLWRPLDTALSAIGSGEPVFGKLKEVEIVLSASTIPAAEIHRFVMGQGELLPSVEARGVMVSVRVERRGEERALLDQLRQM